MRKGNSTIMRAASICLAIIMCVTMSGISAYAIGDGTDNLEVQSGDTLTLSAEASGYAYNLSASWNIAGASSYTVKLDGTTVEENYTSSNIAFDTPIALGDKCTVNVVGDNETELTKGFMSTEVNATSADGIVTVSWSSIEGVNGYDVSAYDSAKACTATKTVSGCSAEFSNLEVGKAYTFIVRDSSGAYESTESQKVTVISAVDPSAEITGLRTLSDYKSVTLKWDTLPGATGYRVLKSETKSGSYELVKEKIASTGDVQTYRCTGLEEDQNYYFKVQPVINGTPGVESAIVKDQCVRPMYIYVTSKQTKTLTSHDGDNAKTKVYAGQRIETFGFGAGKYRFYRNGHLFYITRVSTRNASCDYAKKMEYSDEEAELFIKHKNISTSKKYIMWTSFYTQHLFIFKKKNGEWKVCKDWEVSTGKASTPSPTGSKQIGQKIRYRHNLPYWSCYSTLNAFHGAFSSWAKKLGNPKSGGCIRNKNENAKWIYQNVAKGSNVLNF